MKITPRPTLHLRPRTTKAELIDFVQRLDVYVSALELERNQLLLNAAVDGSLNRTVKQAFEPLSFPRLPVRRSDGSLG